MEYDPDEEEMDNVNLYGVREYHWRMLFDDNDVGMDNAKVLLHAKRWNIYVNENESLVKGGCLL